MKRHAFTLLLFGGLVAALATTASTAPRVIYVSKNGSDANFGTSWSQAWRTIGKVNASAASGDSIVFGSGTWNDATLRLTRGTNSAYTYYACSSLAAPPHIYGADSVGGWTVHSGNVFRASVSSVGNADGLWQGERLLERQTSLNAVSGPGRWYYSSGTVYAYAFGGGDPDNYGMFLSDRSAVTTGGDGSRTYMYGLVLKYGNRSVFDVPIGDAYDSSVIRSCTITSGCGWTGGNPAAIHLSGDYGQEFIHYNRITNCVLGGAQAYYVPSLDGIGTYDFSGGNSASLLIHHMRNSVIDSNLFIDGGEDGHSWMKSGGIAEEALNVVWFANRFVENTKTWKSLKLYGYCDSVYIVGNEFIDTTNTIYGSGELQLHVSMYAEHAGEGFAYIYNNTFYSPNQLNWQEAGAESGNTSVFGSAIVKRNIFAPKAGNSAGIRVPSLSYNVTVDSNQYYSASGYQFSIDGSNRTWSQWRSAGLDVNGVQQNPQFANPGVDFTPANAVQAPATIVVRNSYDPTDTIFFWQPTQYGAVQSSEPPPPGPPTANFSGSPTSGSAPLTVNFTDQSSGNPAPTSWQWNFGDGATSTQRSPSHTYNTNGTYTVTLTVTNSQGSDQLVRTNYISVTSPQPPAADFSADVTSGFEPLVVQFTNLSTNNPTSYDWDFGDGGISSAANPQHTYSAAGDYTVSLTVSNAQGNDTETKVGYITVSELSAGDSTATWERSVTGSADDFGTDEGNWVLGNDRIDIGNWGGVALRGGFRFQNVQIPSDATVLSAILTLTASETQSMNVGLTFHCEDVDDAPQFFDLADLDGRTLTSASTSRQLNGVSAGNRYDFDVTAAVREVLTRPGFATGNDIAIIGFGQDQGDDEFLTFDQYDGGGTPAQLTILYSGDSTAPAGILNLGYMTPNKAMLEWSASENVRVQGLYGIDSALNWSTYVTPYFEQAGVLLLENLEPGTAYSACLMLVDQAGNVGYTQDTITFQQPSNVHPVFARVNDGETVPGRFTLSWTAGGGGDPEMTVDSYDIFYSLDPMDTSNYIYGQPVSNVPAPAPAGSNQSMTVQVDSLAGYQIYSMIVANPDVGSTWEPVSFGQSWVSGIRAPENLAAALNGGTQEATLTCPTVPSYLDDLEYVFTVATSPDFNNSFDTAVTAGGAQASLLLSGLQSDVTYYAFCRARSGEMISRPSETIPFGLGVVGGTLADSDLSYPLDGDTTGNQSPIFTVIVDPSLTYVYFQLDDDSLFRTPWRSGPVDVDPNGISSWETSLRLEQYSEYYWRASGNNVDWTNPVHFYTSSGIASGGGDLPNEDDIVVVTAPNPYRPHVHDHMTFSGLPTDPSDEPVLKIFDTGGQEVKRITVAGSQVTWDGLNESNNAVASGVYYFTVSNSKFYTDGKIIIRR